jgi:hypothetical protein
MFKEDMVAFHYCNKTPNIISLERGKVYFAHSFRDFIHGWLGP